MLAPLVGDAHVAAGGHVLDPEPTRVAGGLRARIGVASTRVVSRLERADPVRELIARRRLNTATRTARAALAARDTHQAAQRELVGRDDSASQS
jgi:hypothetical protein